LRVHLHFCLTSREPGSGREEPLHIGQGIRGPTTLVVQFLVAILAWALVTWGVVMQVDIFARPVPDGSIAPRARQTDTGFYPGPLTTRA
jgi:hypothetical protein